MRSEFILLVIIGGFFGALLAFIFFVSKPALPIKLGTEAVISDDKSVTELASKIKWLENSVRELQSYVTTHEAMLAVTPTPTPKPAAAGKSIIAVANTQGSLFTTKATTYTPMGMYININCPKNCLLWINFYTSSKNTGEATAAQGNQNTYGVFLDDVDKSIFTQASYPVPSTSVPVSLNAAIAAGVGLHTVDIRTKTTGGTLQSDSSTLQVMAIER